MPRGISKLSEALGQVCDGSTNLSVAQAAVYLRCTQNKVHRLTCDGRLHPVRISGHLVFARSDLERHIRAADEHEITTRLQAGEHPLDVYFTFDGHVPLKEIERVLHEWARLTGIWLIEAPRGSYARWLQRFELLRVTPRGLRRFIEAMLVDEALGARVREYLTRTDFRGMQDPVTDKKRQLRKLQRPESAA